MDLATQGVSRGVETTAILALAGGKWTEVSLFESYRISFAVFDSVGTGPRLIPETIQAEMILLRDILGNDEGKLFLRVLIPHSNCAVHFIRYSILDSLS